MLPLTNGAAAGAQAISTTVVGLGYDLVDVERLPGGLLRVTIDHPAAPEGAAERFINVDDCEKVTRQLQFVLEVEGVAYQRLEVSSPGLDRPLHGAADYLRFAGEQVELTLKTPFEGRKRFRGELHPRGDDWRLLLAPEPEAAVRGAKLAAKPPTTRGAAAAKRRAAALPQQVLDFALSEVREARLVPVINFKGHRAPTQADASRSPDETDGGRIQ
ncbi:MAG: ribosome maturation factor RimP [Pseudomonadota bacterium]|nr:ribosome maturation factor RimP [Pseudomonadota bacterium]